MHYLIRFDNPHYLPYRNQTKFLCEGHIVSTDFLGTITWLALGIKVSTAAIKSSKNKLKGQFTPKRKTSKLGTDSQPNIPTDEEKSRGWGFVKNKFLTDSRKKGTPGKSEYVF